MTPRLLFVLVPPLMLVVSLVAVHANSQLTEMERLKVDHRNLKAQLIEKIAEVALLQNQVGVCAAKLGRFELAQNKAALEAEDAELRRAIEAAHPGYTWDGATLRPRKTPDGR